MPLKVGTGHQLPLWRMISLTTLFIGIVLPVVAISKPKPITLTRISK